METLTLEGAQEPQANAASTRLAYLSVMGPANADECYERNNTVQVADRAKPLRPHKRNVSTHMACLQLGRDFGFRSTFAAISVTGDVRRGTELSQLLSRTAEKTRKTYTSQVLNRRIIR